MIECRKEEKELDTMPPGRKKEKKLNRGKKNKRLTFVLDYYHKIITIELKHLQRDTLEQNL